MSVDVVAFHPDPAGGPAAQYLATALDGGRVVSGAGKLAQRLVVELLTPAGDVPHAQGGTRLIQRLQSTGPAVEADILSALAASAGEAASRLRAVETEADPADERLQTVSVTRLTVAADSLDAELTVVTRAGSKAKTTLPLAFILG